MKQTAYLDSTVVVRTGDGWTIERRIGHHAIVFSDQYLSAVQARRAAEAMFPGHQVVIEIAVAACNSSDRGIKPASRR